MAEKGEGPRDIGKVAKMPARDDMLGKLKDAGLTGMTPQSDKFFERFVESVADSEKVGAGLNMAWELAMYDTLNDYPPVVRAAVGMSFNRAIDAVTPDPEVAKQAKEFREMVMAEMKKKGK